MKESVKKEVEQLIEYYSLNCSIREFKDKASWYHISAFKKLSEDFIREFKNKVSWFNISEFQQLSEEFIREFKDKVNWNYFSEYKQLSEEFIREFKNKVEWILISQYQILSEEFIREFEDEVHWEYISQYQNLSENLIREFKDLVHWEYISLCQNLSEEFLQEFKDKIDIDLYNKVHKTLSYEEKLQKVKQYCEKYKLTLDEANKCFYAYREHDKCGRGMYNKTISYKKGKYYRDWHLDMREYKKNSFGLGIFPEGNTKVKILIDDFGACVNRKDGKCRVWGFEIV